MNINADTVATFLVGIAVGVGVMRYGISLGIKIVHQTRENMPLDYEPKPLEQENTEEYAEEEEEFAI